MTRTAARGTESTLLEAHKNTSKLAESQLAIFFLALVGSCGMCFHKSRNTVRFRGWKLLQILWKGLYARGFYQSELMVYDSR